MHVMTMQEAGKEGLEPTQVELLHTLAAAYKARANELFQDELNTVNQANAIVGAQTEIEYLIGHIDCKFTGKEEEEREMPKPFFRPQAQIEEIQIDALEATDDAGTETQEAGEGSGTPEDGAALLGTA